MEKKTHKRLPKILKINSIDRKYLKISVLFSNGEDRILDFNRIFKKDWKIVKGDFEYKLLDPKQFSKVKIANHTLSWDNVEVQLKGFDGKKMTVPYEVGADTLYDLSEVDEKLKISVGTIFREARLSAKLSQEKVAELSGTSRTYITKLENDGGDVEIMTLKKLVEAGLNRHLSISID
jgi:DNA-binding XRE family transcriptional regulator